MWPTFFIPSAGTLLPDIGIDHLCGFVQASPVAPLVVPTPTSLQAGDTQMISISYSEGGGAVFSAPPAGWKKIYDSSLIQSQGAWTQRQRTYTRVWNGTDGAFTLTVTGGGSYVAWLSMGMSNVNTDDPVFSGYLFHPQYTTSYGSVNPSGPAQYLEVADFGDLWFQCSEPDPDYQVSNEPNAADVEFACTNANAAALMGHTLSVSYSQRTAHNLLAYSKIDPAGWTFTGITRDTTTSYNSGVKPAQRLYSSGGISKHYVETTVDLVAGKRYAFVATQFGYNQSGLDFWMTYVKPDNTEHGYGYNGGRNIKKTLSGSTEVVHTNLETLVEHAYVGDNGAGNSFGATAGLIIPCDQTGTYKLRIHISDGTDPNTPNNPPTNLNLWIQDVAVMEVPQAGVAVSMIPTSGTPILPGELRYVLPTPHKLINNVQNGWFGMVFRRNGIPRPLCKLYEPSTRGVWMDFSDNAITDSRLTGTPTIDDPTPLRTSHAVSTYLPDKKFYLELKVDSYGTGSIDDNYCIGMAPFEAAHSFSSAQASRVTGDYEGQYTYCSTGKTFTDGTQDVGTVDTWSVNDYIGCGIDFDNSQITFYRNGVLQKTMTINADQLDRLWVGLFGFFSNYSIDKQARFTYNFRGPFGGRKPSGFIAFDFDNELT